MQRQTLVGGGRARPGAAARRMCRPAGCTAHVGRIHVLAKEGNGRGGGGTKQKEEERMLGVQEVEMRG